MTRMLSCWVLAVGSVCGTLKAADGLGIHRFEDSSAGESRLESFGTATLGNPDSIYRGIQPAAHTAPARLQQTSHAAPPPGPETVYPMLPSGPTCGPAGCGEPECCEPGCEKKKCCLWPHKPCYINPQYEPEWYLSGMIGFHNPDDWTMQTSPTKLLIDPDGGWQGGAAIGWANGLTYAGRQRFELEFAVRDSDIDRFDLGNLNFQFDGDVRVYSGMANFYWDFKHKDRDWYPYAGLGLGGATIQFKHDLPNFTSKDYNDNVFAWQLIGGTSYRVREYMEVFAEARYFSTTTPEFDMTLVAPIATPNTGILMNQGRQTVRSEYHTFGTMFGVRFLLGKRYCQPKPTCDGRPTSGGGFAFRRW